MTPNSEIIEKMKHNERGFFALSQEEKECLDWARKNCILQRIRGCGVWEEWPANPNLYVDNIYRISPDYQIPKEPKIVKCEVDAVGKLTFNYGGGNWYLEHAVSIPNFSHFEYENDDTTTNRTYLPRLRSDDNKPALIPKYVVFVDE